MSTPILFEIQDYVYDYALREAKASGYDVNRGLFTLVCNHYRERGLNVPTGIIIFQVVNQNKRVITSIRLETGRN